MKQGLWKDKPLFRVSVKAIVPLSDKFLLLKNKKGFWDMPGGKVETDEDALGALKRECQEEIGVMLEPIKIIDTWIRFKHKKPSIFVIFYLCAELTEPQKIILSDEHLRFSFFSLKSLADLPMHAGYRDALVNCSESQ